MVHKIVDGVDLIDSKQIELNKWLENKMNGIEAKWITEEWCIKLSLNFKYSITSENFIEFCFSNKKL